jgi:hypothetical protein
MKVVIEHNVEAIHCTKCHCVYYIPHTELQKHSATEGPRCPFGCPYGQRTTAILPDEGADDER